MVASLSEKEATIQFSRILLQEKERLFQDTLKLMMIYVWIFVNNLKFQR